MVKRPLPFQLLIFSVFFLVVSCAKEQSFEVSSFLSEEDRALVSRTAVSVSDVRSVLNLETKSLDIIDGDIVIEPYVDQSLDTLLYIVNYGGGGGWKIFSGDKRTPAVLAEGESGCFSLGEDGAASYWVGCMAQDIKAVRCASDSELSFSEDEIRHNLSFWTREPVITRDVPFNPYIDEDGYWEITESRETEVCEIVDHMTPRWDQWAPYNQYSPLKSFSLVERAPAGCVAIAGAGVLYYLHSLFGIPETMFGFCTISGNINNFSRSFSSSSSAVWNGMNPNYSSPGYSNLPEAIMIASVGGMVYMEYEDTSASALSILLKTNVFEQYGFTCSSGAYDGDIVKTNLQNSIPVIVSATDQLIPLNGRNHCFVIDGYKTTRTKIARHYRWVQGEFSNFTPDPSEYTTISYTLPAISNIKINWGWWTQWYNGVVNGVNCPLNDGWYTLTDNWVVTVLSGETYDYNHYRTMIYGFDYSD